MTTETLGAPAEAEERTIQLDLSAAGRRVLVVLTGLFLAVGWLAQMLCPPILLVVARGLAVGARWAIAAGRIGWRIADAQAHQLAPAE